MEIWGGMECTINRVQDQWFDQLEYQGHYKRPEDLKLVCDLGISKMRYPILWEHHQPKEGKINWGSTAARLDILRKAGVDIIAGLVHHGCGPVHVEVMDDSFAIGLAEYATAVAKNFPWINHYTPVNEPLTTARFGALYGFWYPHQSTMSAFFRMLLNECKATVLAMQAIRKINPAAKLVQTEDLCKVHSSPMLSYQANFENERRWLSMDLLCGKVNERHFFWKYMLDEGIQKTELEFFLNHPTPPDVMGFNYYITSERFLDEDIDLYPDIKAGRNGKHVYVDIEAIRTDQVEIDGPEKLIKEVWNRYGLPIAITEVHLHCNKEDQLRWFHYLWTTAKRLKFQGINVLSLTAWSLFGAYGWDKLLTLPGGNYEAGAFDLQSGKPQATLLAAYIKSLANGQIYEHPALEATGWWARDSRIIYPKNAKALETLF
ncbi:family 1 glycosylhydrolase [Pedobacter sp. MC2016-14]|uniref:family 1 glycosylhydrolase n=1 Tax=Pedobacter sp. MC2016-14 TaxID=2897327 RepID=UPI001E62FBF1|nr:family 1 glycosylhydrolase [Pedobacter sp. MC2016-14]MCD0486937.1 family 1 glycosylhydrolase [Pedobacter sp. MC2016-14]